MDQKVYFPADRLFSYLEHLRFKPILADWHKAVDRVDRDPDGAITVAKSLVESVCKIVLDETNTEYSKSHDLPKLYSLASKVLGVAPGTTEDRLSRSYFGGVHTVVQSIAEMRNELGDSHGKGKSAKKPSRAQAQLAVNLAGSVVLFILANLDGYMSSQTSLNAQGYPVLQFEKTIVWRLLDHAKNAPAASEYYGETIGPALLLVGDSGIYLMSNGQPGISEEGVVPHDALKSKKPYLVCYAEGCNPKVNDFEAWWPIHNAYDDGSDFSTPISLENIERALKTCSTHIVVNVTEEHVEVFSDVEFKMQ